MVLIKDTRIRVAAGLLLGVFSLLASAQTHAAAFPLRYVCDRRQSLTVERNDATAHVNFVDRSYELRRKPSNFGVKYESPKAALIIDGQSAFFVAEDRLQLGACTQAFSMSSAR